MHITAQITGIKYNPISREELNCVLLQDFNINNALPSCLLSDGQQTLAISKWVSPKRTRSYPYERVYNTLHSGKKITVIPIVKDEGSAGDRDFIQWDTVSLMSLLDVFVIFAYYADADRRGNKITNQKFDNEYILSKIEEIGRYHSSALHWNLSELNTQLNSIIDKVRESYTRIESDKGVVMHNVNGLSLFKEKVEQDIKEFMTFSRNKAKKAQARESVTVQPKEVLQSQSKGKITISNYLGGEYFFTVDEVKTKKDMISLIESKHSKNSKLPSKGDIKDGLIKMLLYSNLQNVSLNGKIKKHQSILMLTSERIKGVLTSDSAANEAEEFISLNGFSHNQKLLLEKILEEARMNNFIISLRNSQ